MRVWCECECVCVSVCVCVSEGGCMSGPLRLPPGSWFIACDQAHKWRNALHSLGCTDSFNNFVYLSSSLRLQSPPLFLSTSSLFRVPHCLHTLSLACSHTHAFSYTRSHIAQFYEAQKTIFYLSNKHRLWVLYLNSSFTKKFQREKRREREKCLQQ